MRTLAILSLVTFMFLRSAGADQEAHVAKVAAAIYDASMKIGGNALDPAELALIHKVIAAADAALKDGVPETTEVELKDGINRLKGGRRDPATGKRYATIATIRAACAETVLKNVIDKHLLGLYNPVIFLRKLKDPAYRVVREAYAGLTFVPSCEKAIEAAMADGIPPDYEIKFSDYPVVRARDFKVKVCAALKAEADSILEEGRALMEAQLAPYRAVLKNDKLRIVEAQGFVFYGAYGKDCMPLHTPEDYAKASSFYTIIRDNNVVPPRWTVRGWTFDAGMKLVRGPFETSGSGGSAPASACR